jgi:hypothetical protein
MKIYAYCLSDEITSDALESVSGVHGAATRLIEYEAIRAVVSDFDSERAEVTRENAFLHDGVIRRILGRTTPLPFRFGTVVDHEQLESYITNHRASLLAQLARVRGSVEMSVKIIWNAEAVKQTGVEMAERLRDKNRDEALGPGAGFLQAKRREMVGYAALKSRAEELAVWLGERLGDTVREVIMRALPTPAMAVAASHLVERARVKDYNARLAKSREERGDLRFLTSGAWPPYSFCNLDS